MPFTMMREDITRLGVDAIVNAANTGLRPGGGVCGAIFAAAGYEALEEACRKVGHCPVGGAVITPGFGLRAKFVIHAVGPIWQGGEQQEGQLLSSAYRSALELAWKQGLGSIAFPLISSGIYGYPKEEAFRIAVDTIRSFLAQHDMTVILTLFDKPALLLGERYYAVERYIDDHYVSTHRHPRRMGEEKGLWECQLAMQEECIPAPSAPRMLEDVVEELGESFNAMLLRLIDEKGFDDVTVYKRANLDRKHFSKLRKEGYTPGKGTVMALCIALRLNLDEAVDLLGRAGYALSPAQRRDVILRYCIEERIWDMFQVNELLFAFGEKLLGG